MITSFKLDGTCHLTSNLHQLTHKRWTLNLKKKRNIWKQQTVNQLIHNSLTTNKNWWKKQKYRYQPLPPPSNSWSPSKPNSSRKSSLNLVKTDNTFSSKEIQLTNKQTHFPMSPNRPNMLIKMIKRKNNQHLWSSYRNNSSLLKSWKEKERRSLLRKPKVSWMKGKNFYKRVKKN